MLSYVVREQLYIEFQKRDTGTTILEPTNSLEFHRTFLLMFIWLENNPVELELCTQLTTMMYKIPINICTALGQMAARETLQYETLGN